MKTKMLTALLLAVCLTLSLCGAAFASEEPASGEADVEYDGVLNTDELFTDRDLEQTAKLDKAVQYTVKDGEDVRITTEGVYVLSGTASEVTVYVEAEDEDKVQIVLNGLTVTNNGFPCIYVKNADKVFVTTSADSALSVTGAFREDGTTNTDGVIFSRADLVLNGTALLKIDSTDNGVVCKDDLKITGGSYEITADSKCLEANDSILIADGKLTLDAGSDAMYTENDKDSARGCIYVRKGEIRITAGDDGIHALSVVEIDSGTFDITAAEGIEATYIQVHGGVINVNAKDNGINARSGSDAYASTIELNGGTITVTMDDDKTEGINCNGDVVVNGAALSVTGSPYFDYDGEGKLVAGTVTVNGEQVTELPREGFSLFGIDLW